MTFLPAARWLVAGVFGCEIFRLHWPQTPILIVGIEDVQHAHLISPALVSHQSHRLAFKDFSQEEKLIHERLRVNGWSGLFQVDHLLSMKGA